MLNKLMLTVLLAVTMVSAVHAGGLQVFGSYYFADTQFPQFMNMWQGVPTLSRLEDENYKPKTSISLGGYVFVHFQNTGAEPVKVTDLRVEGIKLSEGLGRSRDRITGPNIPGCSIYLSKLPKEQIEKLAAVGEPIWWKAEPWQIPPKGTGQIVLRLRYEPKPELLNLNIDTDAGPAPVVIKVKQVQPRFMGIYFSPSLDTVYLYLRHPAGKGIKPTRILIDGKDVTTSSRITADPSVDISPVVVKFLEPLEKMSYHSFRAGYPDGSAATAGIRAWGEEFLYGMWGADGNPREFLRDWARHNINIQMGHANKETAELSLNDDGEEFLKSLGIRQMASWFGNARKPAFFFLQDEPDAHDVEIDEMEKLDPLGCLGQGLVERSETLRAKDGSVPQLLNIDNTNKPRNWYVYHQLADIPCLDPYYNGELDVAYEKHPGLLPLYSKPTYVYTAVKISQSSAAPKPLHVILCSTQYTSKNYTGRFPTPEEKRMEVYYALAAGAKGISYWWFTPQGDFVGCGSDDPAAKALWKEIGRLGAEARTAGPLVTVGCPANLSVKAPSLLMVRSLLSGTDTVVLTAVNEDVLSDRVGTVVKPIDKAKVEVTTPSWLSPVEAFEITSDGIKDVTWSKDRSKVSLDLGKVDVSRLIIITADAGLKARLQSLYQEKFAANIKAVQSSL